MEARFMSRPFSLRRSSSVFIRAMLCALLLPVCVAVSAQTNRPAATQEGRQPALDPKVEKLARLVTIYRDSFGVPHIFGKTDAGVVFGMRSVGWLDFTEEFGMAPSCIAESSQLSYCASNSGMRTMNGAPGLTLTR